MNEKNPPAERPAEEKKQGADDKIQPNPEELSEEQLNKVSGGVKKDYNIP